ncbi:MAG: glucosaminidase domain-containing protein [Magnetovibrio sp.]|nr:glucosaminidase domain-containing protein [Magnetovibrio sp.]
MPRITLASFPAELSATNESAARKAIFFKTVLPLVLQVNEQIHQDRTRLQALAVQQKSHRSLSGVDRLWLAVMAARYGTPRNNISALLSRHDVVPPSLVLAQAATESAWGTSRFVREGNAMFGEWTFSATQSGIVPLAREVGKSHRVRAFASLRDSIDSYVTNLNKHRAYKEFRAMRRAMRKSGQTLDGMKLAGTLYRYSQRGTIYVDGLRALMTSNNLSRVDGVHLSAEGMIEPLI